MTTIANWQAARAALQAVPGPIAEQLAEDVTNTAQRWIDFGSTPESVLTESTAHTAWREGAEAQVSQLLELAASIDGQPVGTVSVSAFEAAKARLKAAKDSAPNVTIRGLIDIALSESLPVEPPFYIVEYYVASPMQRRLTPPRSALALREALDRADAFLAL